MGMLIPERFPLDEIETVLDAKSGPGAWAIDLAKAYPAMQVTGMDVDIDMVRMATEDARMAKVANVTFDVGPTHKPPSVLPPVPFTIIVSTNGRHPMTAPTVELVSIVLKIASGS